MHGTGRVKCGNWKLLFPKICNMHNFKLFSPSGLTIVALHVTIKPVNFFHSFSRHNPEKLIRTLRIIGRLEDKQEDIFLEKVEKKFKNSTGKDTEMAEAAACRCCSK